MCVRKQIKREVAVQWKAKLVLMLFHCIAFTLLLSLIKITFSEWWTFYYHCLEGVSLEPFMWHTKWGQICKHFRCNIFYTSLVFNLVELSVWSMVIKVESFFIGVTSLLPAIVILTQNTLANDVVTMKAQFADFQDRRIIFRSLRRMKKPWGNYYLSIVLCTLRSKNT